MVPGGLEPPTLRLLAVRSNQLSYETLIINRMFEEDSNKPYQNNNWDNNVQT